MKVYALLLFLSGIVPLLLSFDKKLQFFKRWKIVFPALLIVTIVYLMVDIYLTQDGIWGFNSEYLFHYRVFGLPLEEVLFFIIVPYACIFIHYAFFHYFPEWHLQKSIANILSVILLLIFILLFFNHLQQTYTAYASLLMIVALVIGLFERHQVMQHLYISFLIMLIPFFVVDGILTGTFLNSPVVWYNSKEILNLRLLSIPVEDFAYGFSLVFFNIWLIELISKKSVKNHQRK